MEFDYVIVGCGFAGSVLAERIAKLKNEKVLMIEEKNHIAGHCYDCYDDNGILIHKYGPHIFHTVHKKVWDYISQFTKWRVYQHEVLGIIEGKKVPIPFNLNTLYALFPDSMARRLEEKLVAQFGMNTKVPILKLREAEDAEMKQLADYVYENIFLFYTEKQWNLKPEELSAGVTGRVPIYISKDNRYFQDRYQAMPLHGYTRIFENMLDNKNIKIMLNTDYKDVIKDIKYKKKLIYSGPIDSYFDYKFGELKYRTLDFGVENLKQEQYQEVGTVNYPNNYSFTRISEYKVMTGQKSDTTTIMSEFARDAKIGTDELYYPMFTDEWMNKYKQYEEEAKKHDETVFVGRLAQYKYYNMDQVIHASLDKFDHL